MAEEDFCYLGAVQAIEHFKAHELSPVELMTSPSKPEAGGPPERPTARPPYRRVLFVTGKLAEPALRRVLTDCYALLGLISFFTVGEDEVRAWSVPRGTRAQDAAAAIHSDIARGFIRAEVVGYDELIAADGSMATVRERGQFRLEGKEYVVADGEICHFRFNVAK